MIKPLCCFAFLTLIIGCATGAPPNAFERTAYVVTTNFIVYTNALIVLGPSNNIVATNYQTVVEPRYHFEPRPDVVSTIQAGGQLASSSGFGAGGIIATVLLGAYSAWASWRSKRRGDLNTVLAQGIEVAREVIKGQPGGAATEARYVDSLKSSQVEAGVKEDAASVSENKVNSKEAKADAAAVNLPAPTPLP